MNLLDQLLEQLCLLMNKPFDEGQLHFTSWGQPQLMTKELSKVTKLFGALKPPLKERSITETLQRYRRTGSLKSFLDLKYTCFGVWQEVTDGWCLFYDDTLFPKLLEQVERVKASLELKRFRKCYQGLLYSYFSFELFGSGSRVNWECLRDYLSYSLENIVRDNDGLEWLTLLEKHRNLLGQKPCDRYARELQDGDLNKLYSELQDGLGVPPESWVWWELVLSQIELVCNSDDENYKENLGGQLKMLQDNNMLSINLVIRCIAMLVIRYAKCSSKPEHPSLRDAAIKYIGNPWLKKTSWDAHVRDGDGQPHEGAREMINGWIKRELIKNFYELLSEDGSVDQRRLRYWLRFEPVIDDMWFALGPYAFNRKTPEFIEMQSRAKGRLLSLDSAGGSKNNAFIIKLGDITVVEFGLIGNAAYIYKSDGLPFNLMKNSVSSYKLKAQGLERLIHNHNWEYSFDNKICPYLNFYPNSQLENRYSVQPDIQSLSFKDYLTTLETNTIQSWEKEIRKIFPNHIIEDNRPKGGAFWVKIKKAPLPQLIHLGFRYKPEKGWWKE